MRNTMTFVNKNNSSSKNMNIKKFKKLLNETDGIHIDNLGKSCLNIFSQKSNIKLENNKKY